MSTTRSLSLSALAVVLVVAAACADQKSAVAPVAFQSPTKLVTVPTVVYTQNFAGAAGSEWSSGSVATSPNGTRYLGEFGNDSPTLALSGLDGHNSVTFTVDVYIMKSWDAFLADGSTSVWSGETFSITADGQTLLNTTFANSDPTDQQNYPDAVGGALHPAGSGAFATNDLGDLYGVGAGWTNTTDFGITNSTYRLTFTVAHTASTLSVAFIGRGLQAAWDESWGLGNVSVTINP